LRLAFAGTPVTALPTLRALLESPQHEVVAVITRPPAPAGRGRHLEASPAAKLAEQAGVPVLTPRRAGDPEFLERLAGLRIECCPVVAYGALLPPAALAVPPHGWVNLHFSLLPAWRGAAPVQHAILHGDDVTGASTFLIDEGLDTGPIYGVVTEAVRPHDTAGELLERLAGSGAQLMVATLDGIADGVLDPQPQSADGVSLAPKITVADARIDWSSAALRVDRLVRACTPAPGAWTTFRGDRVKVGPVGVVDSDQLAPGEIRADRDGVRVGTGSSDVVLGTVQPPGKRPIPAADWARGARPNAGERLG
jgi:methionyl-tRNA formyltransferase